nr:MAG TPA: Photosystem II reaction centre I protein (PSII 4.8 kDa protein) [Crassvirales sp.]
MEKVLSILLNIVLYTILTVFLGLFSFAFLLGLAEGDLSRGLFYYL